MRHMIADSSKHKYAVMVRFTTQLGASFRLLAAW
jgi:hypothetical protein